MTWANRPGTETDQRFNELEKELGIKNLTDITIDEDNGYLYIFTTTKKFRITMTQV